MSYPVLSRLVAAAVNVSQKSARILREVKRSGELNIQEKGVNDYVTKADFLSQLNIIKSLEKNFPLLKFCGEEGDLKDAYDDLELTMSEDVLNKVENKLPKEFDSIKEEDLFVWVDPLDGTKEYTQGAEYSHEVTVLIGVSWQGKPIAGIVNQPFYKPVTGNKEELGRVLWGIVGVGAYDSSSGKLDIKPDNRPEDQRKHRIITTRSHMTDLLMSCFKSIPNSEIIHSGGAGHKVLKVIEGNADCYLYPRNGTKRWDTCAPEAILRAMGGRLTDIFGNDYSYAAASDTNLVENFYGLVATLNDSHQIYLNCLSNEIKEATQIEARKIIDEYNRAKSKV